MSDYKPLACLPVLPLRGIVVFPGCVTHFDVGRSRSARAVEEAMRADQMIFLVAQRDVQCDEPKKTDLYSVGTVAYVRQILRLPGDNMRILVEGKYRAQLTDMIHAEPYLFARAMELDVPGYNASVPRTQALVRQAHQQGKAGYLDVLEARRSLVEARLRFIETVNEYDSLRIDLDRLTNNASSPL